MHPSGPLPQTFRNKVWGGGGGGGGGKNRQNWSRGKPCSFSGLLHNRFMAPDQQENMSFSEHILNIP